MFSVAPKVYASMFSIPSEIAEKHLKFASGEQLKVILCIFRNPDISVSDIARRTGLPQSEVRECVEYWIDAGILQGDGATAAAATEMSAGLLGEQTPVKPILPELHFINPTQAEINQIIKSNGAMKRLFNEAQEILGRTLGYSMQCTVYSVVNFYGLKPDVTNCLLHFAKSIGKTGQSDIQKIAKYWAEHSITDMEAADDYISEADRAKQFYTELAARTGNSPEISSFAALDIICEWIRWGYTVDEAQRAFDIMKAEKNTGRLDWNGLRHMNGTVKNWRKSGMRTLEDIDKGTKRFGGKKQTEKKETSFDVELAERLAKEGPSDFGSIKNKKRKRLG